MHSSEKLKVKSACKTKELFFVTYLKIIDLKHEGEINTKHQVQLYL